jgi:hypothetical protein
VPQPDFIVIKLGRIWLIEAENDLAREHLEHRLGHGALWCGGALTVEPRHVASIRAALHTAGFEVA